MLDKLLATACLTLLSASVAIAEGDAAKGEKVFRKCMACHAVGEDAKTKTGPILNGIVGRAIASQEGFAYSDVLMDLAAEGGTWTPEELGHFLEKPRDYAKGTKMSFAGLRKEQERADVIAFLATHP
ncbi:cytochrome c family protein [Citreicella sp. C3M06]|uniref:c-type cytochrome n=1 Tax=Citreicella sp. C3M06 TaxID=2841564 RepID=UPI001C0A02C0|nr:cytochrome c family protein [Citreicella sp. C3M06]MBU2961071.1 cytochrome c family protein [Citreicella sp. C3M06]